MKDEFDTNCATCETAGAMKDTPSVVEHKSMPRMHPESESAPRTDSKEIVVFMVRRETKCAECEMELFDGSLLRMEANTPLCLDCADLGHLEFLASGNKRADTARYQVLAVARGGGGAMVTRPETLRAARHSRHAGGHRPSGGGMSRRRATPRSATRTGSGPAGDRGSRI